MAADNLLFWNVAAGETFTIPEAFAFASVYPSTGATFTITNSLAGTIDDVSTTVSEPIGVAFTFPDPPTLDGWADHIITAIDASVIVVYANGR